MQETMKQSEHQLILQNRSTVELTGVMDVGNFDESVVSLTTSMGELTIRGSGLHITHLDLDGGLLSLAGKIDTLLYAETVRGLFARLFR